MMRRFTLPLFAAFVSTGCLFGGGGGGGPASNEDVGLDAATDQGGATDVGSDTGSDATTPDAGPDMPFTCGDGALQAHEKCDPMLPADSPGACPTFCDDGAACTQDGVAGSPLTCDAVCASAPIETCLNDDGCCPSGCTAADDDDCVDLVVCGDGVVSGAEVCDPALTSGVPGACPTADDCTPMACATARIDGSAAACSAQCAYAPITQCANGDGCCPPGCESANDDDCLAGCGNGVIDAGELCDGDCPSSCDDGNSCTDDMLIGSATTCDATCMNVARTACLPSDLCCPAGCSANTDGDCSATCGDGIVDIDETCDGNCPITCDDNNACTTDSSTGSAEACSLVCGNRPITACRADGCCAPGCNANNDPDCEAECGNGIVEPGEACDGNCPASSNDGNACTLDATAGSAQDCNLVCSNSPVTSCIGGDSCCPAGCNSLADSDCPAVCGNGVLEGTETCDGNCPAACNDGNDCTNDIRSGQSNQCNVTCTYVPKTTCVDNDGCCPAGCNGLNDNNCSASCGNGVVEGNETCDGNCPTQQTCQNMGPCQILTGSAMACTARCVNDDNCTACNLGGNCSCLPSDLCTNNVCTMGQPTASCTQSCNPNGFCAAWHGPAWKCDPNLGDCYQCMDNDDCQNHQACIDKECSVPAKCSEARNPNAYCVFTLQGTACNVEKELCYYTCNTKADCPAPDHACVGGMCEVAATCSPARNPNQWCQIHDNGGICTFNNCIL